MSTFDWTSDWRVARDPSVFVLTDIFCLGASAAHRTLESGVRLDQALRAATASSALRLDSVVFEKWALAACPCSVNPGDLRVRRRRPASDALGSRR